jgi:hypothetical protein
MLFTATNPFRHIWDFVLLMLIIETSCPLRDWLVLNMVLNIWYRKNQ